MSRTKISDRKIKLIGRKIYRRDVIAEIAKQNHVTPAIVEDILDEFFSSKTLNMTKTGDAIDVPGFLTIYRLKKHIRVPKPKKKEKRVYTPQEIKKIKARNKRKYKLRIQNMWREVNGFPKSDYFIKETSLLYKTMPGETRIKKIYREFMNNYNK